MDMKRFLAVLFALTLVFAIACGGGEKSSAKDDGEDDGEEPTTTAASTAGTAAAASAPAAVAADAATISGSVKLDGAAPKAPNIQMSADPYCQSQHPAPVPDEDVVVSATGQLANVFVYIKDIKGSFPVPATDALIDQKGCQYHPHVQGIQVGQTLDIRNSDATLHNIHAMPVVNNQFNEGQPVQGMVSKKKFDKVEMTPFKMKCDVHGWMHSYMAVLPHPFYAVSAADGTFSIPNLPPGQYTLVAWHEKYGAQEQPLTVGAKEQKTVAFTFKG
jgi:flagella basal body P-ring formation protein FlgA